MAWAKHSPGHGDTHIDSHRSLPTLGVTRERLEHVELVPFRAAVAAGIGSVMIAHLAVPALDPSAVPVRTDRPAGENAYGTRAEEVTQNGTMPATTSKPIITGLLRQSLGFDGLIVSDAMDMGGITEHYDAGEAAIRAIEAGQDQILMSPNIDAAIAAVKAAVRSGRLSQERIDASVRRILAAKASVSAPAASADEIFRTVDTAEHRELAASIAKRALTLLREQSGVLPLKQERKVLILQVSDFPEVAAPLPDLDREVARRLKTRPQTMLIDGRTCAEDVTKIAASAKSADVVLVALAVRARSGAGQIAVPAAARQLIADLAPAVPLVAVSFGSPYLLREVPAAGTYVCAYGISPVMQVAAAQALFGEIPIRGKLPVTIPGLYEPGAGIAR